MASYRRGWLIRSMLYPCSSACTTHLKAKRKPVVCWGMPRLGFAPVEYLSGRFPTQSSCSCGWIRYPQIRQGSRSGIRCTLSSLRHVIHVRSTATGIHSSSKTRWRMCRSISFAGKILSGAFIHLSRCPDRTPIDISRLAEEYNLYPVYKKEFHEVFEEFHEHTEFRSLLQKMNVVDANGETEMDEDQWEAASKSSLTFEFCFSLLIDTIDIYIAFAMQKR